MSESVPVNPGRMEGGRKDGMVVGMMGGDKLSAQGMEGEMNLTNVESSDVLQERVTDEIG